MWWTTALAVAAVVGAVVGIWVYVHWTLYQIWRDS